MLDLDNFNIICDNFYNEVINPLTENYYKEFIQRIKYISKEHNENEDLNQKKKKRKLNDTSYLTSFINFIRGNIFELKDKTIFFQNENLVVKYNYYKDSWLTCYKDETDKKLKKNKFAKNFLPLISYLYEFYYDDYWKVNYDLFIYFRINLKIEFLQVMFNRNSVTIFDNEQKIYKKIIVYKTINDSEKKKIMSTNLANIISDYFNKINQNLLFIYLIFPLKTLNDKSFHANIFLIEKNEDYIYLNTYEPQGINNSSIIKNMIDIIVKKLDNCTHRYLSKINLQNECDKWGYCFFYCNFFLFHLLYFLNKIEKKDKYVPIHIWSKEIIKYYYDKHTSEEILQLVGKYAIFLGLYNKQINYAWGGSGPSKYYRKILIDFDKKISHNLKNIILQ